MSFAIQMMRQIVVVVLVVHEERGRDRASLLVQEKEAIRVEFTETLLCLVKFFLCLLYIPFGLTRLGLRMVV